MEYNINLNGCWRQIKTPRFIYFHLANQKRCIGAHAANHTLTLAQTKENGFAWHLQIQTVALGSESSSPNTFS
jgi:hypothetical protein